jgi:cytochrome bd-type quinol oxidase subunit 1
MTLRAAVRHIYRTRPLRASARSLLPWVALFLLARTLDIAETYVGITSGRGQEAWPVVVAAMQRFGLVPALVLSLLSALLSAGVLLLVSPLLRWARVATPIAFILCAIAAYPAVANLSVLVAQRR